MSNRRPNIFARAKRRKPLTEREATYLGNEIDSYVRIDWLMRAIQASLLRSLDGRTGEEKESIHRAIRAAKADVAKEYGHPADGERDGATMRALFDAKGPRAAMAAWSDLAALIDWRAMRRDEQNEQREAHGALPQDDDTRGKE